MCTNLIQITFKILREFPSSKLSVIKFAWRYDYVIVIFQSIVEESFRKFLESDLDAYDFQNLISSFLSTDTSVVKFFMEISVQ